MLTVNLARSRTTGETITPLFIDPADGRYRETARELIQLFEDHLDESRGGFEDAIDELIVADTDYKITQGLAGLLRDKCKFEVVASVDPCEIWRWLFGKASERYPIVRQPTPGEDTRRLEVYNVIANELGASLEDCYRGMYADPEDNKRLVRISTRAADRYERTGDVSPSMTNLTGSSAGKYERADLAADWLLARYNFTLAQAIFYDVVKMWTCVWGHFRTVFSYMKLFGPMHRIYPVGANSDRVPGTNQATSYEAVLGGPASLFSKPQKCGVRMADFLSALSLCDWWEMTVEILVDETTNEARQFALDQSEGLDSHYSNGKRLDSDVERTPARRWE